jgi:hypothetical protein
VNQSDGAQGMKRLLLLCVLLGCATNQDAADRLIEMYGRHNVDEFFAKYGPPVDRYTMSNGDTFYTWHSDVRNFQMPSSYSTNGTVNPWTGNITATTTGSPGGTVQVFCEVRFLTSPDGTIKGVQTQGTIGIWQLSRCAEIFPNGAK